MNFKPAAAIPEVLRPKTLNLNLNREVHRRLRVSDLSEDQREAYDAIVTWLNRGTATKPVLSMGGVAGSGKSALISILAHEMPRPLAFCSLTGKAASVLARKLAMAQVATVNRSVSRSPGRLEKFEPRPYCGTIHGLVFRPCDACMIQEEHEHTYGLDCDEYSPEEREAQELLGKLDDGTCLVCHPPPPKKKDGPCVRCDGARYLRRNALDRPYKLIVVDESSMVSDEVLRTLLSFGVPILAVGDHGQLPPVNGTGSLMQNPDLRLEKIHRQAEGNRIIALSARIRETGDIDDALEDGEAFTILPRRDFAPWIQSRWPPARLALDPRTAEGALGTVLISWTNRFRVALNQDVRYALSLDGAPAKGEVLICLKNEAPIYNGMRGVLTCDAVPSGSGKAPKWKASIDFCEDGQRLENILLSEHQFFAEKTLTYEDACTLGVSMAQLGRLYDFSYALTCHKMQGSSAPEVGVVLEPGLMRMNREDRTRFIYTAVTRAETHLTVIR